MLKKGTTECIDVRIRVFNLSNFTQNSRDGLEAFSGKITNVIVFDVSVSKCFQMHESRVCVSKDSMTISRDNSARRKSFTNELFNFASVRASSLMEIF